MKRWVLTFYLAGFLAWDVAAAVPMERLWETKAVWEHTTESFSETAAPLGFKWSSWACESARCPASKLTLLGIPVVESVARFSEGKINGISAMLYARGDSGEMTRLQYEGLVNSCIQSITARTGVAPQTRGKDLRNAVKADAVVWQLPRTEIVLEYAMSRLVSSQMIEYRPEFVRVELSPAKKAPVLMSGFPYSEKTDSKGHIRRSAEGDVWIDGIPMVDQGTKGYCFVASAERILRYYGLKADQNELAQLAGSDSRRGTDLNAALDGLKLAGRRLHFRVRVADEPDLRGFEALVHEYNRRATRFGKEAMIAPFQGDVDPFQVMSEMRFEALREVRLSQKAGLSKFQRSVVASVESGQPLLWGVALGLIKEPGLVQKSGGHVRLIVGYNASSNEVLYSDSWGAGHELKRMSLEDAWIIHSFSLLLTPWN